MYRKNIAAFLAGAVLFGTVAGGTMVGINSAANRLGLTQTAATEAAADTSASSNGSVVNATAGSGETGSTIQLKNASVSGTKTVSQIAQEAMPSVVSITNKIKYQQYGYSMFGSNDQNSEEAAASGSGIIVSKTDSELLIVTNNHVVADSSSLSVQFADGKSVDAEIKGTDANADLAVIAVKLSDISSDTLSAIKVAEFGDSDAAEVGDQVVAIGNALGYGQSVTTGIISAKNRDIDTENGTESGLMQTDAAINPGNSGGALLNMDGQVIGINVAKYSSTDVEGMGYSIPSAKAKTVIDSLSQKTTRSIVSDADRGYLGIQAKTVDSETAEAYSMPQGVYIYKITEGSAAANSGLQEKDIITAFDGQSVSSNDDLTGLLDRYKAGETVTITVKRPNGSSYEEKQVSVTLGKNPETTTSDASSSATTKNGSSANGSTGNSSNGSSQNGSQSNNDSLYKEFQQFFQNYQR